MVYVFFKFSNPIKLIEETARFYPNVDINLGQLDPFFARFLPSQWVGEFLFFLSRGEFLRGLPMAMLLLFVSAGMFVLCLLIANRFYYRSWLVTFQVQVESNVPQASTRRKFFDFRSESIFSPVIESLLKKEYFTFFREPSQWIHLAVMAVLISVFVSSIRGLNFILRVAELPTIIYLVLFSFGGFLSASLALRFAFPMMSLEGMSFWALRSMPVRIGTVYWTKFAVGFLLVLVLGLLISFFSNRPFVRLTPANSMLLWFGLYSAFWISLTTTALNLGFGAYFVNYQEKNPIRLASSQGATLTFLLTLVYLVVLVAIFALPLRGHFDAIFYRVAFDRTAIVPYLVAFSFLSAALATVGIVVGRSSLKRDF
jgi:ABC-2 type transport system permease protein